MSKVEWDLKSQSILVLKNRVQARQAILVYDKKDLEWASERGQREVDTGEEVGVQGSLNFGEYLKYLLSWGWECIIKYISVCFGIQSEFVVWTNFDLCFANFRQLRKITFSSNKHMPRVFKLIILIWTSIKCRKHNGSDDNANNEEDGKFIEPEIFVVLLNLTLKICFMIFGALARLGSDRRGSFHHDTSVG